MSHIKTYISYIDDEDGDKEPALIITARGKHTACAIGLSKAWAYTSDTYLIKKAKEFAIHLGLGDTWFETRNVCDVIMNGLDNLVMAVEYQMTDRLAEKAQKKKNGAIELVVNGKTVIETLM
jgi:hypothetical protein